MVLNSEKKSTAVLDLERNHYSSSAPKLEKRRSLLLVIVAVQAVLSVFIYKNKEAVDGVHHVINSMLLSVMCSGAAQILIQFIRPFNFKKLLKFWIWGGINGIVSAYWINFLVVQFENLPNRVLVDQSIGSPYFQLLFIVFNCLWEGHDVIPTLKRIYIKTLGLSYLIFPLSSIISFGFLPPNLIFPFNCLVTLIWTVVLSLLTG
jgi:hypothetical protein